LSAIEAPRRNTVLAGVALSVLLHAGGVATFWQLGTREVRAASPGPESMLLLPDEPEKPRALALGIEHSDAHTNTWKGFAEATEHSAPVSTTEQAALSMDPGAFGSGAAAGVSESPEGAPQPKSASPDLDQRDPPQVAPVQLHPLQPAVTTVEPVAVGAASEGLIVLPPVQPLVQQIEPFQARPVQPVEETTSERREVLETPPAPPDLDQPAETVVIQQSAGAGGQPRAIPGEKSDEESVATAIRNAMEYRPGRPVAREGLQVKTVLPRWSATTRVVARPENAIVRIEFSRSGRVIMAEFVKHDGKVGTGYKDVDGPLLDAVYRWTAKGKDLEALLGTDPDATLCVVIRFYMRS